MQTIEMLETEGHYCLNPECGADSDHIAVALTENGIEVGCYVCGFLGTEK